MEEKFPGADDPAVVEWRGKFQDGATNFLDDGFRTVFTPINDSHFNVSRQYRSLEIPNSWLAPVKAATRTPAGSASSGITAHRRKDGEYLVFVEEDYKAKVLMYRWRP